MKKKQASHRLFIIIFALFYHSRNLIEFALTFGLDSMWNVRRFFFFTFFEIQQNAKWTKMSDCNIKYLQFNCQSYRLILNESMWRISHVIWYHVWFIPCVFSLHCVPVYVCMCCLCFVNSFNSNWKFAISEVNQVNVCCCHSVQIAFHSSKVKIKQV